MSTSQYLFPVFQQKQPNHPSPSLSPHYLLETMNKWFKSAVYQTFLNASVKLGYLGTMVLKRQHGRLRWRWVMWIEPSQKKKRPTLTVCFGICLVDPKTESKERPMFQVISTIVQRHILNEYRNAFHSVGSGLFFYPLPTVSITVSMKCHNIYTLSLIYI